jgi:hypothetical protein
MNSDQTQDKEQEAQDHVRLRSERQERGQARNAHFEAGREQAKRDNALARERHAAGSAPEEAESNPGQQEEGDPE